jgi:hypothetical protein
VRIATTNGHHLGRWPPGALCLRGPTVASSLIPHFFSCDTRVFIIIHQPAFCWSSVSVLGGTGERRGGKNCCGVLAKAQHLHPTVHCLAPLVRHNSRVCGKLGRRSLYVLLQESCALGGPCALCGASALALRVSKWWREAALAPKRRLRLSQRADSRARRHSHFGQASWPFLQ